MHNLKKRLWAIVLAFCIVIGLLVPAISALTASAAEELVNVALEGTATTSNGHAGDYVIENVIDGKMDTNWQTPGGMACHRCGPAGYGPEHLRGGREAGRRRYALADRHRHGGVRPERRHQ